MFQQKCLGVVWGLRYGSTTLVLRQYEGSTLKFFLSQNIFWHRDNFQTKIRQLELHIYINVTPSKRLTDFACRE